MYCLLQQAAYHTLFSGFHNFSLDILFLRGEGGATARKNQKNLKEENTENTPENISTTERAEKFRILEYFIVLLTAEISPDICKGPLEQLGTSGRNVRDLATIDFNLLLHVSGLHGHFSGNI